MDFKIIKCKPSKQASKNILLLNQIIKDIINPDYSFHFARKTVVGKDTELLGASCACIYLEEGRIARAFVDASKGFCAEISYYNLFHPVTAQEGYLIIIPSINYWNEKDFKNSEYWKENFELNVKKSIRSSFNNKSGQCTHYIAWQELHHKFSDKVEINNLKYEIRNPYENERLKNSVKKFSSITFYNANIKTYLSIKNITLNNISLYFDAETDNLRNDLYAALSETWPKAIFRKGKDAGKFFYVEFANFDLFEVSDAEIDTFEDKFITRLKEKITNFKPMYFDFLVNFGQGQIEKSLAKNTDNDDASSYQKSA